MAKTRSITGKLFRLAMGKQLLFKIQINPVVKVKQLLQKLYISAISYYKRLKPFQVQTITIPSDGLGNFLMV